MGKPDATLGADLFPSPSAGDGKYDGTDGHYPCKQCGMRCDVKKVQSGGGTPDGNGGVRISVTDEVGDPSVVRGFCPFCGTANSKA